MALGCVAFGYCRVSSEEQALAGASIPAQEERIRAYTSLAGLTLARVFVDEGVSASVPLAERPAGKELVAALARGEAAHVIAIKLDRLFRDALDALATIRAWDSQAIALHLVDQGGASINTRTALGQFVLLILAGVAEMERALIRERTKTVLDFKRRNGEVWNHEPFGFRREGKRLVPYPEELEALAVAQELRVRGYSIRQICRELEARGLRPRGKSWHPGSVHRLLRRATCTNPSS